MEGWKDGLEEGRYAQQNKEKRNEVVLFLFVWARLGKFCGGGACGSMVRSVLCCVVLFVSREKKNGKKKSCSCESGGWMVVKSSCG